MNATTIGSQVAATLLAYIFTRVSPWLCVLCGIMVLVPANMCTYLFPELPGDKPGSRLPAAALPEADSVRERMGRLADAAVWFVQERPFAIVSLFTLLGTTVGRSAQENLLQYVTKRYKWSWADVSDSPNLCSPTLGRHFRFQPEENNRL